MATEAAPAPAAAPAAPAASTTQSSLYVGDLDRDATEANLFELFSTVRVIGGAECVRGPENCFRSPAAVSTVG